MIVLLIVLEGVLWNLIGVLTKVFRNYTPQHALVAYRRKYATPRAVARQALVHGDPL